VDVPEFDIELIQSDRHPVGVGEPASTVVAPAVANAIFAAVGVRIRHMPITPDAVLEALKSKKA
jgi:CO/xanthine dehydrogenase Mo-binding subunit